MKLKALFQRDERGAVLPLSMIILAFVAITVVPVLSYTTDNLKHTSNEKQETFDLYAADAGYQQALNRLRNGTVVVPDGGQVALTDFSLNGRTVHVTIDDQGNGVYLITSMAQDILSETYRVESHVQTSFSLGAFDYGMASLNGDIHLSGNAETESGPLIDAGDVYANGDVVLSGNAEVNGDASGTGVVSTSGNSEVSGETVAGAPALPAPLIQTDTYLTEASQGGTHVGDLVISNQNYQLGPLHITGNLIITGNSNVTLEGTVYVDGSITMNGNTIISGASTIIAGGNISLTGNAQVGGDDMPFVVSVNGNITIAGNQDISAIVYAMNGDVSISGNAQLYGAMVGNNVSASGNAEVEYCTELADHPEIPLVSNGNFEVLSWQDRG